MKLRWNALGGQMGLGFVVVGVVLLFLGWNGAASYDRVPAQFPYLISGGLAGLGLMIVGGALLIVQNSRADRAALQDGLVELREAIELLARSSGEEGSGAVVAGVTSFHRPDCTLLEGRVDLPRMKPAAAIAAGLTACRACTPMTDPAPSRAAATRAGANRPPSKPSGPRKATKKAATTSRRA